MTFDRCLGYIPLALCAVAIGWAGSASAAYYIPLTSDGDFNVQNVGSGLVAPWTPAGGNQQVATGAQSPFTDLYALNGKGVNVPSALNSSNPYLVQSTTSPILSTSVDTLYFNADFQNTWTGETAPDGSYSMVITKDASGNYMKAGLFVTGSTLYAKSSSGQDAVMSLANNQWYNVRLALDMAAKTYSGVVTPYGGASTTISSRGFVNTADDVNCIYSDTGTTGVVGTFPTHNIDNMTLGTGLKTGLISSDGDFGLQTLGNPLTAPWNMYGGGGSHTVTDGAQSPFTNAFADNDKGAHVGAAGGNPYFVGGFTAIPANAKGQVYLNADFRNNDASADGWTLAAADNAGAHTTLKLIITGGGFYAVSGMGGIVGNSIFTPEIDKWYNVQLTLDLNNDTYSGVVTPFGGGSFTISSRPFMSDSDINTIFSDGGSDFNQDTAPGHDIDNFVLSASAFTAIPEPGTLVLLGCGLIGLLAYAWRKRK